MNWYLAVLKNYAGFSGRARRKEYWIFTLVNFALTLLLIGVDLVIGTYSVLYLLYCLAVFLPTLAVTIRRLHDTGRSGWWSLISMVPFVGGIVLLVFLVSEGETKANQWGVNPHFAPAA
ncbi:DUF805 domain-containing protein [Streptomyces sp. TRM76323]|uniref:DUF805 domain-containing protein n=1 Tax=Streptomyces tamarix TaxID=3078565 RepID=A0ABU3QE54_9ACTN|nr:DUF805 domain-containing protein [Streptomyces tamarix]MDT9681045.1 DUF805 domain-containing protein [Streptomyces tamarix]